MMKLSKEDINNIADMVGDAFAQYHRYDAEKADKAYEYMRILMLMAETMCHDDEIRIDDCVEYVHG